MNLEEKTIRYIFFTIIIILLIISIYFFISGNNKLAIEMENNKSQEEHKETISIGITGLDTLNPILTTNKDVQYILKLIYKPILDISNDLKLEPCLAEEYSRLDKKTYIVKLKEGNLWHDGKNVTAEDVEFTINAIKNFGKTSFYYENIKNIEKIYIIDDYTFKIYLNEEAPFFEYKLVIPVLPKHQYNEKYEFIEQKPVGTGNYRIKNITDDQILLYNASARTKELVVCIYEKNANMYSDFMKQKLDLITTSNIDFEKYIGTIGYKEKIVPDRRFCYLLINQNNVFLNDINLRQAINLVIDKNEIIYKVFNEKYISLDFPDLSLTKEKKENLKSNDPGKILENSGYSLKDGKWVKDTEKVILNISVNIENEYALDVAEIIKNKLEEFGIGINIEKLNDSNFKYNLENGYYDIILDNSIICLEPRYDNYFKANNEEISILLKQISSIDNYDIRSRKIEELQNICQKEIPFIGLYVNTNSILLSQYLKGDFGANWYNIFYNIESWYAVRR